MSKKLLGSSLNEYEEWLSPILKNMTIILREFIVDTLNLEHADKSYIDAIDKKISDLEDSGKMKFTSENLDLYYSCEIISFSRNENNYRSKYAFKEIYNYTEYEFELFRRLRALRNQEAHWIFPMSDRGVVMALFTILEVADLVRAKYTMTEFYEQLKKHTDFLLEKVLNHFGIIVNKLDKIDLNIIEENETIKFKEANIMKNEDEKIIPNQINDLKDGKINTNKEEPNLDSSTVDVVIEKSFADIIDEVLDLLYNQSNDTAKSLIYNFFKIKKDMNEFNDIFCKYESISTWNKDEKLLTYINILQSTDNLIFKHLNTTKYQINRTEKYKLKSDLEELNKLKELKVLLEKFLNIIPNYYKDLSTKNKNIIILAYPSTFDVYLDLGQDCEFANFIDANTETPLNFKLFRDAYYKLLGNYTRLKNDDFYNMIDEPDGSFDNTIKELSSHLNAIKELEQKYDSFKKRTPIIVIKPAILFRSIIIQKAEVIVSYE